MSYYFDQTGEVFSFQYADYRIGRVYVDPFQLTVQKGVPR